MPSPTASAPRTDLPETPLFPSLVRPPLIAGLEREVVIPLVGLVLMLCLGFRPNLLTPALALGIVFGVFPALRRLTRRDPQIFEIVKGHLRLAGHYAATGRPHQRRRWTATLAKP